MRRASDSSTAGGKWEEGSPGETAKTLSLSFGRVMGKRVAKTLSVSLACLLAVYGPRPEGQPHNDARRSVLVGPYWGAAVVNPPGGHTVDPEAHPS